MRVRVWREHKTLRTSFPDGLTMTSAWAASTASTLCPTLVLASTSVSGARTFFSLSSMEEREPAVGLSVRFPVVATIAVWCCSAAMALSLSAHLPVGVSSVNSNIEMATPVMRMKGTMKETRQATWGVRPCLCTLWVMLARICVA